MEDELAFSTRAVRKATGASLKAAVHRARPLSRAGVLERMFTFAFSKLVYPQIWEDPVVDMKALEIGPGHEVIAIASGGCNVLSYLTADPAGVTAVDLNGAHIALGKLKICALQNLPDYQTFFRFFGRADTRANLGVYEPAAARQARPGHARLLGQASCVRPPPHRRLRPQRLPPRPARAFPRGGPRARSPAWARPLGHPRGQDARGAESAVRGAARADLRQAAGPLGDEAARVALRPRHPAGAIRGARGRLARRHRRGSEPAGRAARLRFRRRRQLFRLAGVRPLLRSGSEAGPAALSAGGEFRRCPQPVGPGALCAAFADRDLAKFARGELRSIRAARRPGLDERRRSGGAVDRDRPHGSARARGSFSAPPPTSVCCRGGCPTPSCAAGATKRTAAGSSGGRIGPPFTALFTSTS